MQTKMWLRVRKVAALLIIISFMGAFVGTIKSPLFAKDLASSTSLALKKKYHPQKYYPKIESTLGVLVEKYSKSRAAAQRFAQQKGISYKDNEVTVILVPPPGEDASAIDEVSLIFSGAKLQASSQHFLKVRIPLSALEKIADKVRGISYIRLPYVPFSLAVVSEGVDLSGASAYHSFGYEGQNTKIAIIDLGFNGLSAAQTKGDLPSTVITQDFTGTGIEAGTDHGTAVAEIVYDMAPGAELYLIKIDNELDLENAKDYCITEGVDIINHSVGWVNTNFTDGTGDICDIANDAQANGILWVNSAGNQAKRHYQDFFVSEDGDDWHEFAAGPDETNEIILTGTSDIYVFLTWDCWPATDQDYDLYLYYDGDLTNPVDFSTNRQTGTQPPMEAIYYLNAPAGTYHIAVDKFSANGAEELKIFTFYQDLEYQTPAHSLMSPADASGVMTVAAINEANWTTGPQEDFSSQGPTNDGRTKPDISGPDGVSTFTYGTASFYGTSASSPHIAGAAALLLSQNPPRTANDLEAKLKSDAVDMGSSGKDNIYGSGKLDLALETIPPQVSSTYPADNATDISTSSNVTATFNEDMNANTLNSSTITVVGSISGAHTGVVSYESSTKTLTFNPDADFVYSETVTVIITTGARDLAGNGLDGNKNGTAEGSPGDDYSWSFTTPLVSPASSYWMLSIPLNLANGNAAVVLGDDLGPYDRSKWRLFRWKNGAYTEYPNIDDFAPGRAFWLITKDEKVIDAQGSLVDTSADYVITLEPGWNQIGNPFSFTVGWNEVKVDAGAGIVSIGSVDNIWVENKLWGYKNSGYYQVGGLGPWDGYWVKNLAGSSVALLIPPKYGSAFPLSSSLLTTKAESENNWTIQISAKAGEAQYIENYMGISPKASRQWDREDFSEPPLISSYVSLYFPHTDWQKNPGNYTSDIREVLGKEESWDFVVETNIKNSNIELSWQNISSIPGEYKVLLYNKELNTTIDMREKNSYIFYSGNSLDALGSSNSPDTSGSLGFPASLDSSDKIEHNFTINITKAIGLSPSGKLKFYKLFNYPNPTQGTTTIRAEIETQAVVSIKIFDVAGGLVKAIEASEVEFKGQNTGGAAYIYEYQWNGKNEAGSEVASGIYFYLVEARKGSGIIRKTGKIAVIK